MARIDSGRECRALGCGVVVPASFLMCRRHWYMVPKAIRDRVWAEYRSGQVEDLDFSDAWLLAATEAQLAVAVREGRLSAEEAERRLDRARQRREG